MRLRVSGQTVRELRQGVWLHPQRLAPAGAGKRLNAASAFALRKQGILFRERAIELAAHSQAAALQTQAGNKHPATHRWKGRRLLAVRLFEQENPSRKAGRETGARRWAAPVAECGGARQGGMVFSSARAAVLRSGLLPGNRARNSLRTLDSTGGDADLLSVPAWHDHAE